MRTRIADGSGIAVLRDASVAAPGRTTREAALDRLKQLAREGHLFFVDGQDPIDFGIEVLFDEPISHDVAGIFEAEGGAFLLRVPSGRLQIAGYDTWLRGDAASAATMALPPGDYVLVVHSRQRPNVGAFQAAESRAVGAGALAFYNRVTRLAALGCLPLVLLTLALLARRWRVALILLVATVLASLPWAILSRSRRFRDVERDRAAFHAQLPVYVFQLRPVERATSLVGGWVTLG